MHEVAEDTDAAAGAIVEALLAGGPEAVREAKRLVRERPPASRPPASLPRAARAPRARTGSARSSRSGRSLRTRRRECRSRSSWSPTAARSRSASSAPAASAGSRRSPSPRPTTPARCTPARRTRPSRSRATFTPRSTSARRRRRVGRIHPGYGFLAENADFAETVEAAGLIWIGPPPEALRLGGDKIAAKRIAREAGVPTLPEGSADEIGFPLVVKAAAGGGGRGMRVVRNPTELERPRRRRHERQRERSATGRSTASGTSSARDTSRCSCSETRTAPSSRSASATARPAPPPEGARGDPGAELAEDLRAAMLEAAVAFGRAIGYRSAGTVEFVVDGAEFFFLELNGRIQVEHPVTEAVTGLDLIAEQLRVAEARRWRPILTRSRGTPSKSGSTPRIPAPSSRRRGGSSASGCQVTLCHKRVRPRRRGGKGGRRGRARVRPDDREAGRARAGPGPRRSTSSPPRSPRPRSRASRRTFLSCAGSWRTPSCAPGRPRPRSWSSTRRSPCRRPSKRPRPGRSVATQPPDIASGARHRTSTPPPTPAAQRRRRESVRDLADARHGRSGVEVDPGEEASARSPLVVLEAMKMEIPVHSPFDGTVNAVHVATGDRVAGGALLVELES